MPYLNIAFGILVALMGLNYLEILKIDVLNKEYKFEVDGKNNTLTRLKALSFGVFFALTWSPCSGAYLAFAMNSALNSSTVLEGGLMLFVYSMGITIPIIIATIFIDKLKNTFKIIKKNYEIINRISGIIMILMGLYMIFSGINLILSGIKI
ncbi:MAG: sulfite exporter TauE/SafE family protein [Clostridiales bacterium]|jgi:cytochrome C biogenesis protein|nr:sulfite exporter TauE/SafE family protein [Clostridiales bacterium]